MSQKHRLIRWIPAISWGLVILVLSLMPGGTGGFSLFGIPHFDKIGHFGMYAGWTFFIMRGLWGHPQWSPGQKVGWTLVCGTVIGIFLEFAQLWMHQGRSFEGWDMVANAIGALSGVLAYLVLKWGKGK